MKKESSCMINDHTVVTHRLVWSSSTAQDLWKHTFYLLHSSSTKKYNENWKLTGGGATMWSISTTYEKIKQKPTHQTKLCELHSPCGTSPGLPPPPVGIFTFSTLVQDGTKIKKNKNKGKFLESRTERDFIFDCGDNQLYLMSDYCSLSTSGAAAELRLLVFFGSHSEVTAAACPLLCSLSCYSGPSSRLCVCGSAQQHGHTQTHLLPVLGWLGLRCWSKESEVCWWFSLRTALSAVWSWRWRSPWGPGWWWSRWPEACWTASASETWAGGDGGPRSWRGSICAAAKGGSEPSSCSLY